MGQRLCCAYHIWDGGKVSLFHSHVGVVLKSGYVFPKLVVVIVTCKYLMINNVQLSLLAHYLTNTLARIVECEKTF